ncbi:protein rep [Liquorilactobacillus satsumensis]|uniref:protein rep n=1 Tax=Liquorilactobacillus satsumensis TaxID=259059 RepID=UPI0039EC3188
MSKVLQDFTHQGKPRKWGVRKAQSRAYASRLYDLANVYGSPTIKKFAGRVWSCGDKLLFGKTHNGENILIGAQFCHDRFCALCQWRRMLKMSYQMTKTIQQALVENPSGRFLFITLTVKNCEGNDLKSTVGEINRAIRKLFMRKDIKKNLLGYVKAIEVTVNSDKETYHPHAHILVMVKSTYFKNSDNYLTHKQWQEMWQRAMKVDYEPMISVEAIKNRGNKDSLNASVSEVAKYQTKATQYLSADRDADLRVIDTLRTQLSGNRMLSYNGVLKTIHNRLFKREDEQTEDLVMITGNEHLDVTAGMIVAEWNTHFQNYVITETGKELSIGRKE